MANSMSETLFLQDNLLSEDDWGTLSIVDLSDLTSTSPESVGNEFCLDEEAKYQDYGSFSDDSEDKHGNTTLMNDEFNRASPQDHQDMVDELLNDLLQSKTVTEDIPDDLLNDVEGFPPRRCSTNTSSSAYSSCSSDPSTPSSHSEPASDQASCSSGEHSLEYLIQDQGVLLSSLPDELDTLLATSKDQSPPPILARNEIEHATAHVRQKTKTNASTSRKTDRCRHDAKPSARKSEESDLERAVRLACEETNRLLNMHRSLSGNKCDESDSTTQPRHNKEQKKKDILTDLCEKTILNGHPSQKAPEKNQQRVKNGTGNPVNKPTKRKASPLQDAIDKLHMANKKPALLKTQQTTPFSRSALLNANSNAKLKTTPKEVRVEPIGLVNNEPCIVLSQPQQQPIVTQHITLDGVTINSTPSYTITTNPGPTMTPIQLYVKQETPALQTYPLINSIIQTPTSPCTIGNQQVYLSPGLNTATNLSLGCNTSPVVVKPEQLLCAGGQTIVMQAAKQSTPSPLQPINISNMKPGSDPVILSQSDLSRLAAQGVIKFPGKKAERNLKPCAEFIQQPVKECNLAVSSNAQAQAQTQPVCDVLPSDAAGIINGTSVFVSGTDSQPQRGELDIKALKRHQRMIKNRASACQSRQRRKEYLKTLEDQVNEVAEENRQVREQNDRLRARVKELEIENISLRNVIGIQRANQKKAACVMMLVLFVGINFFPVGLFGDSSGTTTPFGPGDSANGGYKNGLPMLEQGASGRAGRHLLSLSQSEEDVIKMEKSGESVENSSKSTENGLIVNQKKSFWMDDLVQAYKNKHLEKFLQILSETASLSTQRMLRRKLKEELGIRVPLPVPRHRRIAYTPRNGRPKLERTNEVKTPRSEETKVPPVTTPANAKDGDHLPLPRPCDQPTIEDIGFNETEKSRVNDDLTKWAQRYTVDMQAKARKIAEKVDVKKTIPNAKAPLSRYALSDNSSTSEIAIYTRPNKKFDDFLDAINRRNDTFYVVSLNRDHLLLPASVQNTSSRMKMALVMPAITLKDRPHSSDDYETMIHIECEVLNTRMFELKRKDVPDFLNVPIAKPSIKTLDNASNNTISDSGTQIKPTSKRSKKMGKGRQKPTKSAKGEIGRRAKVKLEVQEQERLGQQEEDAVVTEVVEPNPYKED